MDGEGYHLDDTVKSADDESSRLYGDESDEEADPYDDFEDEDDQWIEPENYYYEYPVKPRIHRFHEPEDVSEEHELVVEQHEAPVTYVPPHEHHRSHEETEELAEALSRELAKRHLGHKLIR